MYSTNTKKNISNTAETRWSHVLKTLGKIVRKKEYSDEEIRQMSWEQKSDLINFKNRIAFFPSQSPLRGFPLLLNVRLWLYRTEVKSE